jgi:hypothetical protein
VCAARTSPRSLLADGSCPVVAVNHMAETRNAFVTVCFPPEEIAVLEFAAKETGRTKSSFVYVLVRDQLRAMNLLPMPTMPQVNGKDIRPNAA